MLTKIYVKGQVLLNDLKNDQRGVTAIEYAIVAVAISAAVGLAFKDGGSFQAALTAAMTKIGANITAATTTAATTAATGT